MIDLPIFFATTVLYCGGFSVSAEKCTTQYIEAKHMETKADCQAEAYTFIDVLTHDHPGAVVRGIKCWRMGDFMDSNG